MSDPTIFGYRLRKARERRKISLQFIAERTKFSASRFESLEEGSCARWPVGVYARSHVRAYAEIVGLDPAETVEEFAALYPGVAWAQQDQHEEVTAVRRSAAAAAPLRLVFDEAPVPRWRQYLARVAWTLHRLATGTRTAPLPAGGPAPLLELEQEEFQRNTIDAW